jgi:glutathione S-transferase
MWVLEELGLDYEQVPLNPHAGETRTPDYLALNPSGKIPTLVHDAFVLSESMAINWYLASAFPGTLLPREPSHAAKALQWTSWAITELEPTVVAIMREGRRPKDRARAAPHPPGIPPARQRLHACRSQRCIRREHPAGIRRQP